MARKNAKPQAAQTDPWLTWCEPSQDKEIRNYLNNPNEVPDPIAIFDSLFGTIELTIATLMIHSAASDIVPEVLDVQAHPIPTLESIEVNHEKQFSFRNTAEQTFILLNHIREVWPHPKAVERLKCLSQEIVNLLFNAHALFQKKITLSKTAGRSDAAAKLEKACKDFCMIDLTGDIEKDAEQLFLVKKITPDAFRAAMRSAFKLDREATDEINAADAPQQSQQPLTPAPTVKLSPDEHNLLQQAADNSAAAKDAAAQTAVGISETNEKIDTLSDWLKDWRKHAPLLNQSNPPSTPLTLAVLTAIAKAWKDFKSKPVDESPDIKPISRKRGQKRSLRECLDAIGDRSTHGDKTLNQLLDDAKKDNETREGAFKRILDCAAKNRKRHPQPSANTVS